MLNIYMKPTNYCTVDCDHCYLPEDVRANRYVMSEDKIREVAKLVINLAKMEGHEGVHFIWHGGEPLMLKPEWYYRAGEIFDEEIGSEYFTESMQSSLIPYTPKWAQLFIDRYGSSIGTSVDFTQRKIKGNTEHYLDFWMKKVNMARDAGVYVTPGMVPTKKEINRAEEIVDWICDQKFHEMNVERYSKVGTMQAIDWPSNAQHSEFLIRMFDRLMERFEKGEHAFQSNVTVSAILGILFKRPGDRWGTNCQRQFLVVEPDGSLNTCPDRAHHETPFSNVEDGAAAFRKSEGRRKWIKIQDITHKENHCTTCEYNSWCKSGCPMTPNGPPNNQQECSGFKRFLLHVDAYMSQSEEHKMMALEYAKPLGEQIVPLKKIRDR